MNFALLMVDVGPLEIGAGLCCRRHGQQDQNERTTGHMKGSITARAGAQFASSQGNIAFVPDFEANARAGLGRGKPLDSNMEFLGLKH